MADSIQEGLQDYEDELEEEAKVRAREAAENAEIHEDIMMCELELALRTEEGKRKMSMEMHQRMKDFRTIRYALGPQVLPDDVLRQHGIKTNDELALEILEELADKMEKKRG